MRTIIKIVLLGVIMSTVSIAHAAPELEAYGRLEQVSDVSISPKWGVGRLSANNL